MENNRKVVRIALFVSLALAVYLVESAVPVPVPIPGFKWGFSNFVVLMSLTMLGTRDVLWIVIFKVLLGNFLSGKFLSPVFFISCFGNLSGVLSMIALSKTRCFGYIGISVIGAFANNLAQLAVCGVWLLRSVHIWYFFPYIALMGTVSGVLNALMAKGGEQWFRTYRKN